MIQLSLPDSLSRQSYGLARAEANDKAWVAKMRAMAREIARQKGSVNADDLRIHASIFAVGHPVSSHAWGCIFKGAEWEYVGRRRSEYPNNHARYISCWRLRA